MKKGYITVFFTVALSTIISLLAVMYESVTMSAVRMKSECAVDTALVSAFGEYQYDLWKQYGLIFVDSAYGSESSSMDKVAMHIIECMNRNFDETSISLLGMKDLLGIACDDCSITGYRLPTDNAGDALVEQAVLIMEYLYGIGYIKDLSDWYAGISDMELDPSGIISEALNAESVLESEYEVTDYSGWIENINKDAPDSPKDSISFASILRKIVPDISAISLNTIPEGVYVSDRTINKGNLKTSYKRSLTDKLIFKEYTFENTYSYLNLPEEETALKYETEYLIAGRNSDVQNLEIIAKRILLIRIAANIATLYSDSVRMAFIEGIAWALAILCCAPGLEEIVKLVIVVGWSFFESYADMRQLYSGGRVNLIKSPGEWQTSVLGGLFSAGGYSGTGLSYRDYLRAFLFLGGDNTVTKRFMNVVEADVRVVSSNDNFRLDNCFDCIKVETDISSKRGCGFRATRIKGVYNR